MWVEGSFALCLLEFVVGEHSLVEVKDINDGIDFVDRYFTALVSVESVEQRPFLANLVL